MPCFSRHFVLKPVFDLNVVNILIFTPILHDAFVQNFIEIILDEKIYSW